MFGTLTLLLNYYEPHSQGLTWHRDNSTSERKSAQKGRPVLSVSIGDSCDFGYKAQYDDEDQFVKRPQHGTAFAANGAWKERRPHSGQQAGE